jgi:hypothetical protein
MSLTSPDFESGAYTNFATPAANIEGKDNNSSCSGIATGSLTEGNNRWNCFDGCLIVGSVLIGFL